MHAMVGRTARQLKMPRPDAYAGEALRDSQIVALVFGEAAPVPDRSTPY